MSRRFTSPMAFLLLVTTATVVWTGRHWPPPRLAVRYGPPPVGGPTGRVRTIADIPFVEIEPGYAGVRREVYLHLGDVPGRFLRRLGIDRGRPRVPSPDLRLDEWVEIPDRIWITWSLVDPEAWLEAHAPGDAEASRTVRLCRELEARAGGRFRVAGRTEIYVAADANALDANGREVEEFDVVGPDLLGRRRPTSRLLLTGAEWSRFFGEESEVLSLPRRHGVRLTWIPPPPATDE